MTSPFKDLPLTGRLLLAAPSLQDPNFKRSVILMAAHSQKEGAFGYVLNRPLDQSVADLLPDQDLGALGDMPVFIGGPVATDKLTFASLQWNRKQGALRCQTHLSVSDAIHELMLGHDVRGFVGYAGWSSGQLENEIKRRSWIISAASADILHPSTSEELWRSVLEQMGPLFQLIARTPDQVGWN